MNIDLVNIKASPQLLILYTVYTFNIDLRKLICDNMCLTKPHIQPHRELITPTKYIKCKKSRKWFNIIKRMYYPT